MPKLPYTSEEFIEIIDKNASLNASYQEGIQKMDDVKLELHDLQQMIDDITNRGAIIPKILNDGALMPTGAYATTAFFNRDFGVKTAYDKAGNVYLIMKNGISTDYEYLRFVAGTVPSSVTVETSVNATTTSYTTASPNMMQVGIIHGLTKPANIKLNMETAGNSTYDYIDVTVNITEAE